MYFIFHFIPSYMILIIYCICALKSIAFALHSRVEEILSHRDFCVFPIEVDL